MSALFLIKTVNHAQPLRVHEAGADSRPLCVARVPKLKYFTDWQTDLGPANCKICATIKTKNMSKVKSVNVHVFLLPDNTYRFSMIMDDVPQRHGRMEEPCDSIAEALGYARHALRELAKDKQH